jgi:UDP-glucose 4-epimerase
MHILLTGGAGFIGSHVAAELQRRGHDLTVIDDFSSGALENLTAFQKCPLLPTRISQCRPAELPAGVEVVVHLAATPSVQNSWAQAIETHENNLTETLRVLQWCRERSVRRLVFASSAAVYGHPLTPTIAEEHPTAPLSPYGLQKLTSEAYGRLFAEQDGFEFVALRFFNVYGPRQRADSAYAGVLARFVSAFAEDRDIIILGDGRQTRDFISVSDVARAVTRACEAPLPGKSLVCNVGTGVAASLLDVVSALHGIFPAWKGTIRFAPASPGDIRDSLAQVARLRAHLGMHAETSLPEGLRRLAEWCLAKATASTVRPLSAGKRALAPS